MSEWNGAGFKCTSGAVVPVGYKMCKKCGGLESGNTIVCPTCSSRELKAFEKAEEKKPILSEYQRKVLIMLCTITMLIVGKGDPEMEPRTVKEALRIMGDIREWIKENKS